MTHSKRGLWTVFSTSEAFRNPWIAVEDHDVSLPDGSPGRYGVVCFANTAIGVLPIDADGSVWLVGQYRFALDAYSWELPEGGGPKHEPSLDAAKRELQEETGLSAQHWLALCQFDVSNSVTDEVSDCFLAWGLTQGEASPEPSEDLSVKQVPFAELVSMVLGGAIRDSVTIVAVLTALEKARRGDLPEDVTRLLLAK